MTRKYLVYMHTTPSGKVYIGITCQRIEKRWKNGRGYEGCTAFFRAIQKYGWKNIKHEILAEGLSKDEACQMERQTIAKYKSHDPKHGYNLTSGGEHYEPNDEWRRKLSEANKKYYREHPEARVRISESQKGRPSSGKSKERIRQAMKQYFIDHPEQRYERGKSFRGKKRGEEFGRKLGERKSKRVKCIETGATYCSIKAAAEAIGVHRTAITNVLHGRAKTCGGFTFAFCEEV